MRVSLFPIHDICLRAEEYQALVEASHRANAIINKREEEEEENRLLADRGRGRAIFRTKDGMECTVRDMTDDIFRHHIIKRVARTKHTLGDIRSLIAAEARAYERTNEIICGLPVYEEI